MRGFPISRVSENDLSGQLLMYYGPLSLIGGFSYWAYWSASLRAKGFEQFMPINPGPGPGRPDAVATEGAQSQVKWQPVASFAEHIANQV